jgi:hypothetical protein
MQMGGLEIGSLAAGRPHLTSHCRVIHVWNAEKVSAGDAMVKAYGIWAMLHAPQAISIPSTSLGHIAHNATVVGVENPGLYMPPAVLDASFQLAAAAQDVTASSKLHIPATSRHFMWFC